MFQKDAWVLIVACFSWFIFHCICVSDNTTNFFVVLALPLTSTSWFDQHIQTLRSAVDNLSNIKNYWETFLGTQRIKPRAAGWEGQTLPVLCRPLPCGVIMFHLRMTRNHVTRLKFGLSSNPTDSAVFFCPKKLFRNVITTSFYVQEA